MGEIVSIWIKRAHGGPMDPVGEAELVVGRGVRGSVDQGGKRQLTIIDEGACGERASRPQRSGRPLSVRIDYNLPTLCATISSSM